MKRIAMILLGVLTLPAYGGIASQEYVDSELGKVSDAIDKKADKTGYTPNMLLQTTNEGTLTASTLKTGMIESGAVTNSKLASNIGLDKLDMGTLPTSGKHIMIWNSGTSKYVFEPFEDVATGLQCPAGQYDIGFAQCVDPSVNGGAYGYYSHDGQDKNNDTTYNLSAGEWAAEFSYGIVKGNALCSSTNGHYARPGDPDGSGSGYTEYCWCKMTSPSASRWVFNFVNGGADYCAYHCAHSCANTVHYLSDFRSVVFGSVGN